jgi:hypothetical protein
MELNRAERMRKLAVENIKLHYLCYRLIDSLKRSELLPGETPAQRLRYWLDQVDERTATEWMATEWMEQARQ